MFSHGKVSIRVIEERDLETLRAMRNEQSTWTMLRSIEPITAASQRDWFDGLGGDESRLYWVIEDLGGEFLGMVRMDERDLVNRSVRVGADIVPAKRGQGWGRATYETILKWCFDYWGAHRVWLCVMDYNTTARALYEKMGFKVEGCYRDAVFRDGHYVNEIVMSILEDEYRAV